ncbi:MAG: type IX secretion system membrane protein PorP/SprF [Chitinophagaceae bacterium]
MKSALTIVCALGAWGVCNAQQKPHYTQYIQNQYIINPALSGIENYTDVNLSHRHQWTNFDGSPVTTYLTVQGAINKKDYRTTPTSYEVQDGENPVGREYWDQYTAAPAHHGVGFQFLKDNAGALSNVSAYATYAYHIGLSPKLNLSAGFGAGFTRYSLDVSKLDFMNTTVDPSVYNSDAINKTKFDMNAGVYLYSSKYFIGLSALQLTASRLIFSGSQITTLTGTTVPHLFLTGGYRVQLSDDFFMLPSLMFKYIQPLPMQAEANVKFQYRDALWAGFSYRHKDGIAGMIGMHCFNTMSISYSYDYTTSTLSTYNSGSHEIILGLIIGNKYNRTRMYSCTRKRLW